MSDNDTRKTLWAGVIIAAALYLLALPFGELRASDEAIYAAIAEDMIANNNWLTPHFQGLPCPCFPLYPWLVALCSLFQKTTAFTVRLPAALAVFGLAAIAGITANRHRKGAGAAAALIVLTSFVSMRLGLIAQSETVHALLLSAAWFYWYETGPQRAKWGRAWGVALALVTIDLLNVGLRALIIFYLPLIFTNSPPRIRRQMQRPTHFCWLLSYFLLFYVWCRVLSNQPMLAWDAAVGGASDPAHRGFWAHLFMVPVNTFVYMLPWGLFAWIPFCLALRPLEPAGSVCSFLRTVVILPLLVFWILPGFSPLMLLPALAPTAVLISFNLPIVLHRNEPFFRGAVKVVGIGAAIVLAVLTVFWLLAAFNRIEIIPTAQSAANTANWAFAAAALLAAGAFFTTLTLLFKAPLASAIAGSAFAWRFCYLVLMLPLLFATVQDRRYAAAQIRGELSSPAGVESGMPVPLANTFHGEGQRIQKVYLLSDNPYAAVSYYIGVPVSRISSIENGLPGNESVVYVLSQTKPTAPEYAWSALSQESDFTLKRQFHADMTSSRRDFRLKITRQPNTSGTLPGSMQPARFRLYRGIKRNTAQEA